MAHLNTFVERIHKLSPLQGKATQAILDDFSQERIKEGEELFKGLLRYADNVGLSMDDLVTSYLSICNDTRKEQLYFARHGKYRLSDASVALEQVYDDENVMRPYMLGLAVTQVFWAHHQQLFGFFEKCMDEIDYSNYLEIGPGHGLFLVEAIEKNPDAKYTAIDLSKTSIQISKDMLDTFLGERNKVNLLLADLFKWDTKERFDFITVGEVLEHVERPDIMLEKIGTFLSEDGYLWASTCANAPAIDHVFLFEDAQHIRDVMIDAGYKIMDEVVVETETGVRKKGELVPTINYAALLKKA